MLPNSAQLDRKLSNTIDTTDTTDTTDTEDESGTWFWNESANETDSDTEEEGNGNHENDLEGNESRTEEAVSSEVPKVEIKWNREGEDKLRGRYGKGSKRTRMRQQKSARELEKEASKTYDIRALWQRSKDLGMSSSANSQVGNNKQNQCQLTLYLLSVLFPKFREGVCLLFLNNKLTKTNKLRY